MPLEYINVNKDTTGLFAPQARAIRTMAIVGKSSGGISNRPVLVNSAAAAEEEFGSGALIDAVIAAFRQSPGPSGIWLVKEGASSVTVDNEPYTQGTSGNKEFTLANRPLDENTAPIVRMKVTPTINPSKNDDLGEFNQLGAATILFGVLDPTNNKVRAVVTDSQNVGISGAEVNFVSTGTTLLIFSAPKIISNGQGYAEVTVTPVDAQGNTRAWAVTDEVTIWSVMGDLDSATGGTAAGKDGSPDDDVVISYVAAPTADKVFVWFSEVSDKIYGFLVEQSGSDVGGVAVTFNPATDVSVNDAATNISAATVNFSVYKQSGASITNTDNTAIYDGWGISKYGAIANSNIEVTISTITSSLDGLGAGDPLLHTYDLISAAELGAMTSSTDFDGGTVFLSQEPGLGDILEITYALDPFVFALRQLNKTDFHALVGAGKTSASDIRVVRDYVAGRQNTLSIIGVFALDYKSKAGGNGLDVSMALAGMSSSMVLCSHDDPESDVAGAVAGAIAGRDPWKTCAMLDIAGVVNTDDFSDTELDLLTRSQINVLAKPPFKAGIGLVLSYGFSLDGSGQRTYIDIQRTLNHVEDLLKRTLTNPLVIGESKVNKTGLEGVRALANAVLAGLIRNGAIEEGSRVDIPLLTILRKGRDQRNDTENAIVQLARNTRMVVMDVLVEYAGSIHQLNINLKFTG